jgi:hypothetical protein
MSAQGLWSLVFGIWYLILEIGNEPFIDSRTFETPSIGAVRRNVAIVLEM